MDWASLLAAVMNAGSILKVRAATSFLVIKGRRVRAPFALRQVGGVWATGIPALQMKLLESVFTFIDDRGPVWSVPSVDVAADLCDRSAHDYSSLVSFSE